MKRAVLLALSMILIAVATPPPARGASSTDLKPITFLANYAFHGRHSPFFVGLDKGFYKDAGFDVEVAPTTGSRFVVSAVEGGKADYGMADAGTVVQAIAKGAKVKAFAVFMDVTTSGLAGLTPHPTPKSLMGETIATSLTDSSRVVVPIIFKMHGLDASTIKWQAADPGVYFSLLLSGQTDLIAASIDGDMPALMEIAKKQGKGVYYSSFAKWGYDVFGYVLIGRTDSLANDPDAARRFALATRRAVQYAIAHPEETARIMVKYNPTLKYDITLAQWTQSIKAINTDYVKEHGYGVATRDRVQRTINLVGEALGIDTQLTPDDVYAFGLLQ
jgi:NitT/TauT family transport system substrate-binding protein